VKQDPNYAALFGESVDSEEVISMLRGKISMLRNEWNDPDNIFSKNKLEVE